MLREAAKEQDSVNPEGAGRFVAANKSRKRGKSLSFALAVAFSVASQQVCYARDAVPPGAMLAATYAKASGHRAVFNMATGMLILPDGESMRAASGYRKGLNNPKYQSVPDMGPIPLGMWNVAPVAMHYFERVPTDIVQMPAMALSPTAPGEDLGRTHLYLHASMTSFILESAGCIVVSYSDLKKIVAAREAGIFDEINVMFNPAPHHRGGKREETSFIVAQRCDPARKRGRNDVVAKHSPGS